LQCYYLRDAMDWIKLNIIEISKEVLWPVDLENTARPSARP
jgi:hypothetical protein